MFIKFLNYVSTTNGFSLSFRRSFLKLFIDFNVLSLKNIFLIYYENKKASDLFFFVDHG